MIAIHQQHVSQHKAQFNGIYDSLSLSSSETTAEKYLELLGNLLDELVIEQQRFQMYSKNVSKLRQEHIRWLMKRIQENVEARENGKRMNNLSMVLVRFVDSIVTTKWQETTNCLHCYQSQD